MGKLDNYVKVNERVVEARKEHGNKLTIKTSVNLVSDEEGNKAALFTAEVSLDGTLIATGHSLSEDLSEPKTLEKAESVAVGRALAFAGYAADSSIASAEEMEDFATQTSDEGTETETATKTNSGFGSRSRFGAKRG